MSLLIFFLQKFKFHFKVLNLILKATNVLILKVLNFGLIFEFSDLAAEQVRRDRFIESLDFFVGGRSQWLDVERRVECCRVKRLLIAHGFLLLFSKLRWIVKISWKQIITAEVETHYFLQLLASLLETLLYVSKSQIVPSYRSWSSSEVEKMEFPQMSDYQLCGSHLSNGN